MITANEGARVFHKSHGGGKISRVNESGRITIEFDSGSTLYGLDPDSPEVGPELPEHKFKLERPPTPELRDMLQAADRGETANIDKLVDQLDGAKEFRAVNAVCSRLEELGIALDLMLLIKDARAYRKVENPASAIGRAKQAHEKAANDRERSMAKTVHAASLCDVGKLTEAEIECGTAIQNNPKSYRALRAMGRIKVRQFKYGQADECFDAANELDPSGAGNRFGIYRKHLERLIAEGNKGEIAQIRTHIQAKWPPEIAQKALTAIDQIVRRLVA